MLAARPAVSHPRAFANPEPSQSVITVGNIPQGITFTARGPNQDIATVAFLGNQSKEAPESDTKSSAALARLKLT